MVNGVCFAVARGRKPGVYINWSECEAQILNFKGAKYKKFLYAADAELWIHQNATGPCLLLKPEQAAISPAVQGPVPALPATPGPVEPCASAPPQASDPDLAYSATKSEEVHSKVRNWQRAIARDKLPGVLQHSVDPVTEENSTIPMSPDVMIVYTDGSCKGNGTEHAVAGVGVWWGDYDSRNICERCPGDQTNNRAELIAIIRVLETTPTNRPLLIKTDSEYSIKCMTRWLWSWKAKGWKKIDGKPIKNLPLVKYLDVLLDERRTVSKQDVKFEWIKAHAGLSGNEDADALAVAGADLPAVPERDWEALAHAVRARIVAASSSSSVAAAPVAAVAERASQVTDCPPKVMTRSATTQPVAPSAQSQAARKPVPTPSRMPSQVSASQPAPPRTVPSRSSTPSTTSPHPSASQATSTSGTNISDRKPRTPLSWSEGDVHGSADIKVSQKELEAYVACLLNDDDLLEEARAAGIC
ncbi:ribonuclease H-like domain-containing protein [Dichomitus squalens]|uniref:Ribonuclease H n=1 Tax=Dichomitus squalens TaxID=114155 RepID=A0A4Q9PUN4_9APHY|nr:ribonuclease H-like domain-containing protein [Dichomitus squalens]